MIKKNEEYKKNKTRATSETTESARRKNQPTNPTLLDKPSNSVCSRLTPTFQQQHFLFHSFIFLRRLLSHQANKKEIYTKHFKKKLSNSRWWQQLLLLVHL